VLGLLTAMLKPLLGFTFVADLHNAAIDPSLANWPHRKLLALMRHTADLCIVSNPNLVAAVERDGGKAFVLPDKLPDLPAHAPVPAGAARTVVFVCTYASDEPWREVIEAARLMDPHVTMFITGNHSRVQLPPRPDNVNVTGFLSERDYIALLRAADVIVDLTCLEDCLVCGAYEAASLGKALVTSDTAALRAYFNRGTVYTKHDSRSLAAAMTDALARAELGIVRSKSDLFGRRGDVVAEDRCGLFERNERQCISGDRASKLMCESFPHGECRPMVERAAPTRGRPIAASRQGRAHCASRHWYQDATIA
jgi:glycosyltransferase involved in cell wall biosynthesis